MTGALAARARGLVTTVIAGELLGELDRARDPGELVAVLARAGLRLPGLDAAGLDGLARARLAADLAILARWTDALDVVVLDEDRRSLRGLVRGLVAGVAVDRRLAATLPTGRLPARTLAELAAAPSLAELGTLLARLAHPLASALAGVRSPVDPLGIELALAQHYVRLARPRDRAARCYVVQTIDAENAAAALLLAARGSGIASARAFVTGGERIDRATFARAIAGPLEAARARLARALAGTPLAAALFAPAPAALDDAALAWQLDAQAELRRREPLGLAPAIYAVLRRRDEARHLRRAGWRIAMGAP